MKRALFGLVAVLVLTGAAVAGPRPVTIRMDMGGWIPDYTAKYEQWNSTGRKVVIDGDCRSACTYML